MSRRGKVWPGAPWFYNQEFYDIHSDNRFLVKIYKYIGHLDLLKIIAQ